MPITRLDMISMAPKTQEAGNQRQQELQRPATDQANIAGTIQQQTRQKDTSATKLTHTENEEQKYDAREGRGKGAYGNSSEKKKEEEKEKQEKDRKRMLGSTFDITI